MAARPAPAPPRHGVLLLAALLCAYAAGTATAKTIRVTATSCAGIGAAFSQLNEAYSNATRSATISLMLTLDCAGSFECNSTSDFGVFQASTAPTKNGKQPRVKISVSAGSRCRKGASRPLIDVSLAALQNGSLISVDRSNYPRTAVRVTVTGVQLLSIPYQFNTVKFLPYSNTCSSLTSRGNTHMGSSVYVVDAETVTVESDDFLNETASALYGSFSEISQAITALSCVFEGVTGGEGPGLPFISWVIKHQDNSKQVNIYDCVFRSVLRNSNATANVTANATSNATDNATTEGYAVTLEYNGEVSASLERNTYTSNSVGESPPTAVCIKNAGTATRRPRISVAGSTGLTPTKPGSNKTAPWPTTEGCNVAAFQQMVA